MSAEKTKEVEKIIKKVEQKKDLTRNQAIDYMLGVAAGRLAALWRYDDSVPEGKQSKGILAQVGKKKRAAKVARISVLPESHQPASRDEKPTKKSAKKQKKSAKKRAKKQQAAADDNQLVIEGAAE